MNALINLGKFVSRRSSVRIR